MLALSFGSVTSVCVCEPRHVWTAASCFGLRISLMSKMDAAESFRAGGSHNALRSTVDATAGLLHGHEQQLAVHGHVALPAWTDNGAEQPRTRCIFDGKRHEAVEISQDRVVLAESQIGIREIQSGGWRRCSRCGGSGRYCCSRRLLAA